MAESTKNMTVGAGNASASVTATVTDQMPGVPCPTSPGYEYTGMRYVPVFADPPEWSSANSYEPLEIVIHKGNSYTSKTFVPVGIDISNEDFWALTGNYNAQVEQYRQEVKALQNNLNNNYSRVFATHQDMIASDKLIAGTTVKTMGYYAAGDSGGTVYSVTATQPSVPFEKIGDLYVHIADPTVVTPEMFGAKGDGATGDTVPILAAIEYPGSRYIVFGNKTYAAEDEIAVYEQRHKVIMFNGATIKGIKGSKMGGGALFVIYGKRGGVDSVDSIDPLTMTTDITVIGGIFDPGDPTGDTNCLGAGGGASNVRFINTICINSHRKAYAPQSIYDNVSIENACFINCRSGLEAGMGRNFTAKNITIITDGSTNNATSSDKAPIFGVNVANVSNVLIENVTVKGYETSLTSSTSSSENVVLTNCNFDGGKVSISNSGTKMDKCVLTATSLTLYLFIEKEHVLSNCIINASGGITINSDDGGLVRFLDCVITTGLNASNNVTTVANTMFSGCTVHCASGVFIRPTLADRIITVENCKVDGCTDFIRATINNENGGISCFGNHVVNTGYAYALYSGQSSVNVSSFGNFFASASYYAADGKEPAMYVDSANGVLKSKVA